jgi:nucleoid DNA-binding protein
MELEDLIQREKEKPVSKVKVPEISVNLSETQVKDFLRFINENIHDLSKVKIVKFGNGLMLREGNEKSYIRLEKE